MCRNPTTCKVSRLGARSPRQPALPCCPLVCIPCLAPNSGWRASVFLSACHSVCYLFVSMPNTVGLMCSGAALPADQLQSLAAAVQASCVTFCTACHAMTATAGSTLKDSLVKLAQGLVIACLGLVREMVSMLSATAAASLGSCHTRVTLLLCERSHSPVSKQLHVVFAAHCRDCGVRGGVGEWAWCTAAA